MARCKNCKEKFEAIHFNQKYCLKEECKKVWLETAKKKQWKQTKTKMKKELETVTDWVGKAQHQFNLFIRLRDKGNVCISCQKPPKKKNAGHYWNANNHWNVRFDERNVHLQCEHCNTSLSGNQAEYTIHLIEKIGIEEFEDLKSIRHINADFTIQDMKEMIEYYKAKVKELE